jgi:deazaflavin-dependent oxidoreductase (nitroreductase family)
MPIPKLMARVNKKVLNPMEIKKGKRPMINHTGRTSGKDYHTPLDAHPVESGFVFIAMYGADSDWVQNVIAIGAASVDVDGETFQLDSPRIITADEAFQLVDADVKKPPGYLNVTEYLLMDTAVV